MNTERLIRKVWLYAASWRWRAIGRWLMVAVGFSMGSLAILYTSVRWFRLSLPLSTFLSAEIATILRFFVNNRWVFDNEKATWRGLWQFHLANGGGFAVWWGISNLLPRYGVPYLLAAVVGIGGSVGISILTNFLWIWRRRRSADSSSVPEHDAVASNQDTAESAARPSARSFPIPPRNVA
jgi:putative flippase GtrA